MAVQPSRSGRLRALAAALVLAVASVTWAQDGPVVLHRPIPGDLAPSDREIASLGAPRSREDVLGTDDSSTPGLSPPGTSDILRPPTDPAVPTRTMDRETASPPGMRLPYEEVFVPSITPFKRVQAYDAVDAEGRMTVRDPSLRLLRVADQGSQPETARFSAEAHVSLDPDRATPIPSVAGEQRVVAYATSDGEPVAFATDSAGNLFVRAAAARTVFLSYTLEAPQRAMQAPSLTDASVMAVTAEAPVPMRPVLPARLQREVLEVTARLGVSDAQPLSRVLRVLVGHFRAFRDDALTGRDSLYKDLALGGVGACRHRAYAMLVTLHGLGLPARYVGNEAHAWVEAWLGRSTGWTRLDLGGWDVPLDDRERGNLPRFRALFADPFPRPENYVHQFSSRGTGTGSGGTGSAPGSAEGTEPDPIARAASGDGGLASGDPSDPALASGVSSAASAEGGDGGLAARPEEPSFRTDVEAAAGNGGTGRRWLRWLLGNDDSPQEPRRTTQASDTEDTGPRTPVELRLSSVRIHAGGAASEATSLVRGGWCEVAGEARDPSGAPVPGLALTVVLVPSGGAPVQLGGARTDASGHYEATLQLPRDLPPGRADLRVETDGDGTHAPARAE